jgi:hypothetical protein
MGTPRKKGEVMSDGEVIYSLGLKARAARKRFNDN